MALWVPVGRNPTGIPKSRALPRAGGGDDTDQLGFVAELLQLDVRVDLDVPVAVPARLDKNVVVDEPGGEDPSDQQQVVDLLLAERDRDANQPDDGRRRPERHFPGPRQIALRKAADQSRDADQAIEHDQQDRGKGHDRDQATLEREDGRKGTDYQRRHPRRAAGWLDLADPLADHRGPSPVASRRPNDPGELERDSKARVEDGDDGADRHDPVEGVAEVTKALMSGTPKTTSRKVPNCRAIPIEAARTTARPTCLASPSVSSEKLMALS